MDEIPYLVIGLIYFFLGRIIFGALLLVLGIGGIVFIVWKNKRKILLLFPITSLFLGSIIFPWIMIVEEFLGAEITRKQTINEMNNALQKLDFEIFIPTYVPEDLELRIVSLVNYFNPNSQYLHLVYSPIGYPHNQAKVKIVIDEFRATAFSPPEDCGLWLGSPRNFGASCQLFLTTPKGRHIYKESHDRGFFQYAHVYVKIASTLIVFRENSLSSDAELIEFVDSFGAISPSAIRIKF